MFSPQRTRSIYRYWYPTAIAFFVNGTAIGGWAAQIPRVTARLQVDDATFGLMLLGMAVGAIVSMVLSGRLIARYGAGPLIRPSFLVFLVAYIALSVTPSVALFVPVLLLFGASSGMMDVAMNAYASEVERHMDWRVMASLHGMWSIGGLIGAFATSHMLAITSDLTQALGLSAVLLALFLTCQHNMIRLQPRGDAVRGGRLAIDRLTLALGVLGAICFSAEGAVRDWSSLYLSRETGAGIDRAGWGFAAMSAAMALCRFTGDWMRLRLGEERVMIGSGIVAIAGFLLAISTDHHSTAVAGFALVGLGLSNTVPIIISATGRSATPGPSVAFVVSLGYGGLLAAPPLLGLIAAQTSLTTLFLVVAAGCVAISAGWVALRGLIPR